MPDINHQNFEPFESTQGKHGALEADIKRLSKEIAEKRNLPEYKDLSERKLVKKSLEPMFRQTVSQPPTAQPMTQPMSQSQILPDYLKDAPLEIKLRVEELVDSLFHQGIEKVVSRARRASPFILDAFHDALTDKLYEELKRRKLI